MNRDSQPAEVPVNRFGIAEATPEARQFRACPGRRGGGQMGLKSLESVQMVLNSVVLGRFLNRSKSLTLATTTLGCQVDSY